MAASKYAPAWLIDALFIAAPWNGKAWWKDNCLERITLAIVWHTKRFQRAIEAAGLPRKDALEVYYLQSFSASGLLVIQCELQAGDRAAKSLQQLSWSCNGPRCITPGATIQDVVQVGQGSANERSGIHDHVYCRLATLGVAAVTAAFAFDLVQRAPDRAVYSKDSY